MTSDRPASGPRTTEQTARVADRLVALADTLVDDFDVVELLDRLVADCVDLLEVSAAGILLRSREGVLEVVASSSEASRLMEVFQLEAEEGPCIETVTTGAPVLIEDVAELRRRWPAFADAVTGVGFSAVHALPLRLRAETIGALNLFSAGEVGLSGYDRRLAQALADVATIGILQQRSLTRASLLAEQLQLALNSRIAVEQAKGVISEYGGVEMGAAFEAIRAYARERRTKLSEVAAHLVDRTLDPAEVIAGRAGSGVL
jgi:GAF domain-containing protein